MSLRSVIRRRRAAERLEPPVPDIFASFGEMLLDVDYRLRKGGEWLKISLTPF